MIRFFFLIAFLSATVRNQEDQTYALPSTAPVLLSWYVFKKLLHVNAHTNLSGLKFKVSPQTLVITAIDFCYSWTSAAYSSFFPQSDNAHYDLSSRLGGKTLSPLYSDHIVCSDEGLVCDSNSTLS